VQVDTQCAGLTMPVAGNTFISTAGTISTDNALQTCTTCTVGKWASTACSSTADTVCETHTAAVYGQTFVSQTGTNVMDNQIQSCTQCAAGQWSQTVCTTTSDTVCIPFTAATAGTTFVSTAGSATTDNILVDCHTCNTASEWMRSECTVDANRECSTCSDCSGTTYKQAQCTATSDTQCTEAPTYNQITVHTGTDCAMANGTVVPASEYISNSMWDFSFKGDGGVDSIDADGSVTQPCAASSCGAKGGSMDGQQVVDASKDLIVPKKVVVEPPTGISPDGWCISSVCIASSTSGSAAYGWQGKQWMNPGSTGPDAGAANSWTFELRAVASCSEMVPAPAPTPEPTAQPTVQPTAQPTVQPTTSPTKAPTTAPTIAPTIAPTTAPTTAQPTAAQAEESELGSENKETSENGVTGDEITSDTEALDSMQKELDAVTQKEGKIKEVKLMKPEEIEDDVEADMDLGDTLGDSEFD